jgi:UDP-3-O-[3-hydroxymyristoyl] N-acetylglucosamine deacetylase
MTPPHAVRGLGLFTGQPCSCTITPAGHPLRFVVNGQGVDAMLANLTHIPVHPAFAQMGARSSNLAGVGGQPPAVLTVEHILGACAGMGLWQAELHLDAPEVPIDDGSARAFVELIDQFYLQHGSGEGPQPLVLREPITVNAGYASITATPVQPGKAPVYTYDLDYGTHSPIAAQSASWTVGDRAHFREHIAPARTFSLLKEVQAMRGLGLFSGFTPADLLVINDDGTPIDNAWRFDNEPARHKLLDLIGDLALIGAPLHADVHALRSGHALNHELGLAVIRQLGL